MKISIIGLGYVGLPLAIAFDKVYPTVGYDISEQRINDLQNCNDYNSEISSSVLKKSKINFTSDVEVLKDSNIYIITVPTPIDEFNQPDLICLQEAAKTVGAVLDKNNIVILESTVFPGATEEICVPILEKVSGLKYINNSNCHNKDINGFYCGYSAERINPGDQDHPLQNIKKITSGSTEDIAREIDNLYKSIIKVGTYRASSIAIAEAAKVIENTQRDVNIALINEFAIIFNKLNIDTNEVLEAASTKWNFHKYEPGLVGGHCIGVDPFYLAHKAISIGYVPKMILSGRSINDNMALYVKDEVIKLMKSRNIEVRDANILIMGLTFKEDCKDLRNSKVFKLVEEFRKYTTNIDIFDPMVEQGNEESTTSIELVSSPKQDHYDTIVVTVGHSTFIKMGIDSIKDFAKSNAVIFDVKSIFPVNETDGRL